MAGIADAALEESDPEASALVITKLACSLRGVEQEVHIVPGTHAAEIYGVERSTEQFMCRFGVNEAYRDRMFAGDLRVSGVDAERRVRMAESISHPFFMGTLFMPQMSSEPGRPHPLLTAFVRAASAVAATEKRARWLG